MMLKQSVSIYELLSANSKEQWNLEQLLKDIVGLYRDGRKYIYEYEEIMKLSKSSWQEEQYKNIMYFCQDDAYIRQ
jgi:hypothetical protein